MKKHLYIFLCCIAVIGLRSNAQFVTLSPGFGSYNGFTYSNLQAISGATIQQRAYSVMVQPDGKLLIACESTAASMLLRLNHDGTPDASFGVNGKVTVFAGKILKAVRQPDGKILIGISNTGDFTFVRYNADGSPDVGFGNRGIAIVQAGYQSSTFIDFTLQPDGKIVGVGWGDYFVQGLGYNLVDAAVVRLLANGSPDNSFDGDGKKLVPVQSSSDAAECVDIDLSDPTYPTGKIVIGGHGSPGSGRYLFTARLLPDGSMDASYGNQGMLIETFTSNAYFSRVKVFPNGKIIGGGSIYSNSTFTFDLLLVKYNNDGSRDNSFSGDGLITRPSNSSITEAPVKDMRLLADDKIIVASGRAGGSAGSSFAITRYNANGSLDNTFDTDGIVPAVFNPAHFDDVLSMEIDNNGRYIIAGESNANYGKAFLAVSRYNTDGTLDLGFDTDGKYIVNFPGSIDYGRVIIRQPDGKLLVGLNVNRLTDAPPVQTISEYAIIRYNTDGSMDNTWGTNGIKYTGIITAGESVRLALQPDGKILLAGNTTNSGYVTVARFTNTGAADNSFDGDGKINITSIGGYPVSGTAGVAVTSQGQVMVACKSTYNFNDEIGLIRLNANGSLDNSYGSSGLARVGLGYPIAMLMMPDDKVLLTVTNNPQGNLKRILSTGFADASFNNGTVNVSLPGLSPNLVALTTDAAGNIIVAGSVYMPGGTQALLARITPAGNPDGSFGTNGIVLTDIAGGYEDQFNSVNVQTNGTIIAAGTLRRAYNDLDLLVTRFSANGVRDLSLNNNAGHYAPDLRTGSFDNVVSYVQSGTILYGTGFIRTDQSNDVLLVAIDLNSTTLPVKFGSFTARAAGKTVLLNWTTQLEQNLQHYVVERSADGRNFSPLANVAVKAANSNGNTYSYIDALPMPAANYYRISSIDVSGTQGSTPVRMVSFTTAGSLTIFPNPAQHQLQLLLPGDISAPVEILIYDNSGRRVLAQRASQSLNQVDIRSLAPGMYYVYVNKQQQGSFLKQ
ncbi:MAG: T9SS type A sorting domain-containing protein [Chitinophagaceae bacterium]|nr:MAG: T9SS type A sorting domain-containing protein [Chitinophagaceae bacterium]